MLERGVGFGTAAAATTGLVAGLAGGLLGIGGGLIIVPVLTLHARVPIKRAVGTSLLAVLALATLAVATELAIAPANVHWLVAGLLALGAVTGSWLGARLIVGTPALLLARLLALLLVVAALRLAGLVAPPGAGSPVPTIAAGQAELAPVGGLLHAAAGFAAGVISALFGVGGGIVAVPALGLLHPDWLFQECRATSLAMIVPTSLAGALLHGRLRQVDGRLARALVPASLAGAAAGVLLANRLPARPLELAFAALLGVTALRLSRRREPAAIAEAPPGGGPPDPAA